MAIERHGGNLAEVVALLHIGTDPNHVCVTSTVKTKEEEAEEDSKADGGGAVLKFETTALRQAFQSVNSECWSEADDCIVTLLAAQAKWQCSYLMAGARRRFLTVSAAARISIRSLRSGMNEAWDWRGGLDCDRARRSDLLVAQMIANWGA